MPSSDELREQGIAAAKAKRPEEARQFLQLALRQNPQDELAWLYLASVTDASDRKTRLIYLQRVLLINPANDMARKAVQAMGLDPEQVIKAAGSTGAQPPAAAPPTPQPPVAQPFVLTPISKPQSSTPEKVPPLSPFEDDDAFGSPYDDADDGEAAASPYDDALDDSASPYDDFDEHESPYDDLEDEASPYDDFDPKALGIAQGGAPRRNEPTYDVSDPFSAPPAPLASVPTARAPVFEPPKLPVPPARDMSLPGVPRADVAYLERALVYAEGVAQNYLDSLDDPSPVEWVKKERRRAGEREFLILRLQITLGVLAVGFVLGVVALIFISTNPEAQAIVFGASRTPSRTPTRTPTPTPGFTLTPSPTRDFTREPTFTSSPTLSGSLTPAADIRRTPRPTEINYLDELPARPIVESVRLINLGEADVAVPTLSSERRALGTSFNPYPFYFEALARALVGDYDGANEILEEADTRLTEIQQEDARLYQPIIDLAYAEIRTVQAAAAYRRPGIGSGQDLAAQARQRLESVIEFYPRIARSYVLRARLDMLTNNYNGALNTLNNAQLVPELAYDVAIIMEKADIYRAQGLAQQRGGDTRGSVGSLEAADYQAYLALYINPYEERASALRINTALDLGRPGSAVLGALDYLFYHPENPRAYRYLGDARRAEGNIDLALEAYSNAVRFATEDLDRAAVLVARANLYLSEGRYEPALADLNEAFTATPTDEIRALRMGVAYEVGDLPTALADAEALSGTDVLPEDEIRFIRARVLVDQGTEFEDALSILNTIGTAFPMLDEYRARAYLGVDNLEAALTSVEQALRSGETIFRHYLRGQILEDRGELVEAVQDYEYVLAWDAVYGFSFADDTQTRLAEVRAQIVEQQNNATATAAAATASFDATATAVVEATSAAATETMRNQEATEAAATATARAE